MSIDKRAENRINATLLPNPGPYLARIVNNVDPMKQGALEVELLRPIGNTKEHGPQLFVVRYLSPFYGVTPLDVTGTDKNEFNDTQKSYGFWAVPPDVGVTVMVIFVDSDPGQGFWIGCVQDALMNHMIPGIASTDSFRDKSRNQNDIEWLDVEDTRKLYGDQTKYLPVGEINRRIFKEGQETPNPDVEANDKPVHPLAERLLKQGLINDNARGHTSSSARRESPSNVYGWSTPGPIDKRKGAKLGKIGKLNDKIDKFVSRMGGHCFIMDDGNDRFLRKSRPWEGPPVYADLEAGEEGLVDWPADEQIRIRTRKGAQILLHSTEDLIYITNSRGTAWMEFTSEGKILMYAQDGIEQTSGGDINVTSRRDMNFDVGRNKKVSVQVNYTTEAQGTHTARAEGSMFHQAGVDYSVVGGDIYHEASYNHETRAQSVNTTGTSYEWNVGGSLMIDCSGSNFEVRASNVVLTGTNDFHIHADEEMRVTGANVDILANGGDIRASSAASTFLAAGGLFAIESASHASINTKAQLNFMSKQSTSVWAMTDIKLQGGSASGKVSIANKIFTKADEIHLNGNEPFKEPDKAYADIDKAKEALAAQPAAGAAGASTAGGGREYAQLLQANYTFPNDQGGGLSKTALSFQPTSVKENENPAVWHQANTDGDNPRVIRGGKKFTVKTEADFDKVPGDLGGGDAASGKGKVYYASSRIGSGNLPNYGASFNAVPKSKENIPPYPRDWTKDSEFLGKVSKVAGSLGISRNELLAIMAIETGRSFSPSLKNRKGSATGLIQIIERAANAIGTSTYKLKMMTRAEQMDWVEKYFQKNYKGNVKGIAGAYLAVIAPNINPRSSQDEIYKRGSHEWSINQKWHDKRTGKITLDSISEELKKELDWVNSALGAGGNDAGSSGGGGPAPSFTPTPFQADPRSLGTNVPYPGIRFPR